MIYKNEPMEALLDRWEMIKKDKHGKNYHDQQKNVSPFVLSADGMIGRDALFVLFQLSRVMAEKGLNPFCKYRGGYTVELQLRSRGRTHE